MFNFPKRFLQVHQVWRCLKGGVWTFWSGQNSWDAWFISVLLNRKFSSHKTSSLHPTKVENERYDAARMSGKNQPTKAYPWSKGFSKSDMRLLNSLNLDTTVGSLQLSSMISLLNRILIKMDRITKFSHEGLFIL